MKAEAKSITFLGNEGVVQIPFFQRGYVWDRDNWEDLLSDLSESDKPHFLGSLILKQMPANTGENKTVMVIDGQQRLTTLSVLIKAIYDLFEPEKKAIISGDLKPYLFYKQRITDENHHVKIIHSRIDSEYYKQIIGDINNNVIQSLKENDIENINSKSNKILQCYKYFNEQLKAKSAEKRKMLFNYLLNVDSKILVLIDLSEHDNEQAIFDTINSAGIRLTGTDIVKNALFQRAMNVMRKDEVIKLYDKTWDRAFMADEETSDFWSTQKATGRLMRDHSEILLQSIAVIKGIYDPDKHTLSELPELYKKEINKASKDELISMIQEIHQYALIYKKNIPFFENSTLYCFSNKAQRLFHILDVCDLSTFHPYVIFLFKKYDKNEKVLLERLMDLEQFVIKRMITKKETKAYNKMCKEFINNENLVREKNKEINETEIQEGLENIINKYASLLLFWIELYRRDTDQKEAIKELKYNYSLEHILPHKWEQYWSNVPSYDDECNEIIEADKIKENRNAKICSIGNMTLLNGKLNTSLRNYPFERKIEGEGRRRGIKYYGDLKITKDDILRGYDNGNRTWNEKNINERKKTLAAEVLEIWHH